jgi:hypothetical protein
MNEPIESRPQPFKVGNTMFVRIPGVGLCHMGAWGWQPCAEGYLEALHNIENRKGEET